MVVKEEGPFPALGVDHGGCTPVERSRQAQLPQKAATFSAASPQGPPPALTEGTGHKLRKERFLPAIKQGLRW